MNVSTYGRKAVSPIIATLLLIAITVAAGIVVYVFVGGLSANLSKSGGNQVTEQLSMDAYNFNPDTSLSLTVRNTGTGSVTLNAAYFNGQSATASCVTTSPLDVGATVTCTITTFPVTVTSGISYQLKLISLVGAIFSFIVVAGSSG